MFPSSLNPKTPKQCSIASEALRAVVSQRINDNTGLRANRLESVCAAILTPNSAQQEISCQRNVTLKGHCHEIFVKREKPKHVF